jgi:tetratricopeptide (TPR) repeat protein
MKSSDLLSLAKDYSNKEEHLKAVGVLEDLINSGSSSALVYEELAYCLYKIKRFDDAVQAAQKSLSIDKNLATPHAVLALVNFSRGLKDEALVEAKMAYDLDPQLERVIVCYGIALMYNKKITQGVEVLENALETYPNSLYIYHNLSNAYAMLRDAEKTYFCSRKMYELKPSLHNRLRLIYNFLWKNYIIDSGIFVSMLAIALIVLFRLTYLWYVPTAFFIFWISIITLIRFTRPH